MFRFSVRIKKKKIIGKLFFNEFFTLLFIHTIDQFEGQYLCFTRCVCDVNGRKKKKKKRISEYAGIRAGRRNIGCYVALPTQGLYCANCKQSVVRETAFYAATGNDIRPAQLTLYYFSPLLSYRTKSSWQENPRIYLAPNFEFRLSKRAFSPFHHKCPLPTIIPF